MTSRSKILWDCSTNLALFGTISLIALPLWYGAQTGNPNYLPTAWIYTGLAMYSLCAFASNLLPLVIPVKLSVSGQQEEIPPEIARLRKISNTIVSLIATGISCYSLTYLGDVLLGTMPVFLKMANVVGISIVCSATMLMWLSMSLVGQVEKE